MIDLKKFQDTNPNELYSKILPELASENFFGILNDSLSFLEFHKKLISLSVSEHGVGISVSIMAQVNIAGTVLKLLSEKYEFAKSLLNDLILGKKSISLGISEPLWKGKISNIKSEIDENLILNAEKTFFTNGGNSSEFILVVKKNSILKLVILSRKEISEFVENFNLDFAIEATHARIKLVNFKLIENQIYDLNYREYSENLRLSEILSLNAIFVGYTRNLISKLKEEFKEFEEVKLYKILFFLNLFEERILDINEKRDLNKNLELSEFYPFGLEFFMEETYLMLEKIFPKELIQKFDTEKKLFLLRDLYTEILIKKKAKKEIYSLLE